MTATIPAGEIRRGHSIPGLDNAYIVDTNPVGDFEYDYDYEPIGPFKVEFTFHDANGEEGSLTVWSDNPITVDKTEPDWVG